jgi:predicted GIY-YIG superfamily endonuclease
MVYLIHLDEKYKHAQHYTGFAKRDAGERLETHRSGNGSKFLAAVNRAGIGYVISRIWENEGRTFERKIKNSKNVKRYCPICQKLQK